MKRIAYFTTQYATVKSGPGRFAEYLSNVSSDKISFIFITDDIEKEKHSDRVLVSPKSIVGNLLPFYWIYRAYCFYKTFLKWTNNGHDIDAILCSSALEALFLLSLKKKLPVYVMINDYKYMSSRSNFREMFLSNKLRKTLSRFFLFYVESYVAQRASYVIANSNYTKNMIRKTYNIPDERLFVLYKAVDSVFFQYKYRDSLKCTHFLFIKNDWRIGGLDLVIEALSQLDWQEDILLTAVGVPDGDKRIIEKIIKQAGFKGKCTIHPLMNRTSLLPLFYENDIYISMPRQEPLGVSILEALSTGLPVITSNAGGIPEVLNEGKSGIMINQNDLKQLVYQLNALKADPSILKDKIIEGRKQSLKFSPENLALKLEQLFT